MGQYAYYTSTSLWFSALKIAHAVIKGWNLSLVLSELGHVTREELHCQIRRAFAAEVNSLIDQKRQKRGEAD